MRTAVHNSNINLTKDYVKTKLLQMDIQTKAFVMHREGKTKCLSHICGNEQPKGKKMWLWKSTLNHPKMEGGYDFHQPNLKDESALIQLIFKINLMS